MHRQCARRASPTRWPGRRYKAAIHPGEKQPGVALVGNYFLDYLAIVDLISKGSGPARRSLLGRRSSKFGPINQLPVRLLECRKKLLEKPRLYTQITECRFGPANHLVGFQQPDLITGQWRIGQQLKP